MSPCETNCMYRKQPCMNWRFILGLILVACVFLSTANLAFGQQAKQIILMIADGRGPQHDAATNAYTGTIPSYQSDPQWIHHWVSTYPYGGSYDASRAWTMFSYATGGATDSSAAATAIYSGIKTKPGRVSVSHDGLERFYTIGEIAKSFGKGTGVVTTVPISDATPGVFCAHNDSRKNTYAIVDECLFGDPNTTGTIADDPKYAGGHGPTVPTIDVLIGDGAHDFVNDAIRNKLVDESGLPGKHVFVKREAGIDGGDALWAAANDPTTVKLVGLFDHVYRNDPSYSTENPTLAESTQAALAVLQKNPNGFLLVVEGGAVDWAAHDNIMDLMIGEMIDFNEAVDAVIDWVNTNDSTWANTLVIITSDHETGYLTPRPGVFQDQPLGEVNDTTLALEKVYNGTARRASWIDTNGNKVIDSNEIVYWAWNSSGHSNTLVPLCARGIGAELFDTYATSYDPVRGFYLDNTNIFSVMANAVENQSPIAVDDFSTTTQDTPVEINVIANDIDPDGTIDPTTVTITSAAGYGTAIADNNGIVTYTPNTGFNGTDTFKYTVKDNRRATSNEATVTVKVLFAEIDIHEGTIGTEIRIVGSAFGDKKGRVFVGNLATKILKKQWGSEAITCKLTKIPRALAYPATFDVKIRLWPNWKTKNDIILTNTFIVRNPEINYLSSNSGKPGSKISIFGKFFGSKKPKVYLEYESTKGRDKKRYCRVSSWSMNPNTNEGTIEFVVPKVPKGYNAGSFFQLKIKNRVGITEEPVLFAIN